MIAPKDMKEERWRQYCVDELEKMSRNQISSQKLVREDIATFRRELDYMRAQYQSLVNMGVWGVSILGLFIIITIAMQLASN